MHLAIDLRVADATGMEMTGSGRYALEATRALQRARPDWRFTVFSNRPQLLDERAGTSIVGTRLPTQRAIARVAWLHTLAAPPTLRLKPDAWFSPAFVLPIWWRGPSIVTIHDLTFLLLRERYRGRANAWYATAATRYAARRAERILCGSRATLELLVAHLGVAAERVSVIPYGVADRFFEGPPRLQPSRDPAGPPYLLFVGTWEARKGLATLYEALRRLNRGEERVRLILAGQPGWGTEDLLERMRADRAVELLERPDDAELTELYSGALALVYPSEMEGFGLPVAEAMACGCPVIATELPSIREFAGDHPLYIDQGDNEGLAEHAERLLSGTDDGGARARQGREAVLSLRWSSVGERTAELIERLPRSSS